MISPPRICVTFARWFKTRRHSSTVMMFAITRVHTIEKVTARCLVSMSGPGTSPMIMKAPRRIAIAPLPGTPNAMVGMRSPPSFELFAAPGPRTPRMSPLPKPCRSFASRALWTAWA